MKPEQDDSGAAEVSDPRQTVPGEAAGGRAEKLPRRVALARLGIAAGVAYAAPTVLRIDRSARAMLDPSAECPPAQPVCPPT